MFKSQAQILSFFPFNSKLLVATLLAGALTACGGGSSGGTNSSSSSSVSSSSSSSFSSSSSSSSSVAGCELNDSLNELPGFYVSESSLLDVNDKPFVMRGVNYPYAWFRSSEDTEQKFADIATTGANAVRVVLSNGEQWERVDGDEVSDIIAWAKANKLVAVLEVHDATGWDESSGAADPQTAVDYWLSCDIRQAIEGEQAHVIVNIANEPLGNSKTDQWVPFHSDAIEDLRAAGLPHTLIVDAPNWGQDWTNTMRDGDSAQSIFNADPDGNVVFSIHMYDVYGTESSVNDYFQAFDNKNLPLIVGEFAADHGEGKDVAEAAIMAGAEAHGFGYLGWSWSGNSDGSNGGDDLSGLDIVNNFTANDYTEWGETLINGANGILATAESCSCFAETE